MQNIFIEFLPPWVETGIQPAFYDKESGTVLQQTARMYAKVNELVNSFNELSDDVTLKFNDLNAEVEDYIAQFNDLHDYVYDYFDNLNVQQEINNKIDAMVLNGTMAELIAPAYNAYNKNSSLLAKFYQKLTSNQAFTINCQGDSLTYGQDTVSDDKRPASSDPVDSGATHTQTRASVTYPEELQADFDEILGSGKATINNLGFSGDSAKLSYEHWTTNRNADLAIIMLGTNDSRSSSSWLPADYRNNVSEYLKYMGYIIEQYLNWNTAVILVTPPTFRDQGNSEINGGTTTRCYVEAIKMFGKKYNCPVIDSSSFITLNFDSRFYSDGTHFNGTGYKAFADKLFATFCGTGALNSKFNISTEMFMTSDINNPILFGPNTSPSTVATANNQTSNNKIIIVRKNGKVCYGFNTEYDNAVLIPLITKNDYTSVILDFESEQPLSTIKNCNNGFTYNYKIENQGLNTGSASLIPRYNIINAIQNGVYITIPAKGYHTIEFKNSVPTSGDVYLNGFIILPLNEVSKYINKLVFSLQGVELTNNEFKIPLNLINLICWTNVMDQDGGRWSICPILDINITSGGGMVCYKANLLLNNGTVPITAERATFLTEGLYDLKKYVDVSCTTYASGSKSDLASITVDETDLILTFDTYNSANTSVSIG